MTERTFADWVEPLAAAPRESRAEVVAFARSLPPEAWERPSPLPGWSCRDLLAHLAGDTGKLLPGVLRSVIAGQPLDPAVLTGAEEKNERDVLERRGRTVDELISEIEDDGKTLDECYSQLTDEHRDLRQDGFPMSLGEALSNEPGGHFREHLADLRSAVEGTTA